MLTEKFEGGSIEHIQGIDVNIPPVGWVYNRDTGKLEKRGVHMRSPKKSEQYWERQGYIENYDKLLKLEQHMQSTDPTYEHPELAAFRNECWDRRINGMWFYNNGVPTYVTGLYWFYLEWIYVKNKKNNGFPNYRDSDRKFFLFMQYAMDDENCLGIVYVTKRREGKALDIETDIPTPDGFKKLKDIKVGDTVFDKDGNRTKVTFVTETMYNHKCYNVLFDDGASVIADAEHRWLVRDKQSRNNTAKRYGEYSIETTESMLSKGLKVCNGKENNFHIPFTKPVDYAEKDLPIDPWILGCWLGDGSRHGSQITSIDDETIKRFGNLYDHTNTDSAGITRYYSKNKQTGIPFRTELKELGLLENKHIPECYMTSSYEQRMELIRGLFDTDGYIDTHGRIEFCNKRKELVYQVSKVLNSLGLKHKIACDDSFLYDKYCGKRYRLKMTTHLPVFSLKRKRERLIKEKRKYNWAWIRAVVGIEEVESRPVKCIEVDSPSHTFLCTRDYIVTHNTVKSVAFALDWATRKKECNIGIQSKTEDDAKGTVYMDGVVNSYKRLPDFFKPKYDGYNRPGDPKNGLMFTIPNDGYPALDSEITFGTANIYHYDGKKLGGYIGDEVFKTKLDIERRHDVIEMCLTDTDSKWDGFAFYTSTVEEIEGHIELYQNFWNGSNQEEKDQVTGITTTGLYRYFLPSDEAEERDIYGFVDSEAVRERIMARRQSIKHDHNKFNSYVKKVPLTIEEAFRATGQSSLFDTVQMSDRIAILEWKEKDLYDVGNFYWKDGEYDTEVIWKSERNGRFKIRWERVGEFQPNAIDGRFVNYKVPANKIRYCSGCDPYDDKYVNKYKRSNGAFVGYRKFDPHDQDASDAPMFTYANRPDLPSIFYEDVLMACVYFGMEVLIESNKSGIIKYFEDRGYDYYMMKLKGRTDPGIPATTKSHNHMIPLLQDYYGKEIDRVDFVDLLRDSMNFDASDTRKSDLTMAFGWALVGDKKISAQREMDRKSKRNSVDLLSAFAKNRRGVRN